MPNTNDAMNALLREAIRGRRPLPSGPASKSRDVELGAVNYHGLKAVAWSNLIQELG